MNNEKKLQIKNNKNKLYEKWKNWLNQFKVDSEEDLQDLDTINRLVCNHCKVKVEKINYGNRSYHLLKK